MKNKTKYKLLDEKNVHQFTLVVEKIGDDINPNVIYTLKTSKCEDWSEHFRNTKLVKAIDTGDGIIIEGLEFKLENDIEYDYSNFEYLALLLHCIRNIDTKIMSNYTIVKKEPKV